MTTLLAVLDRAARPLVWVLHHFPRRPARHPRTRLRSGFRFRRPVPAPRTPPPPLPPPAVRPVWPPKPLRAGCDRRPAFPELRAEDHALVRPYVLHAEERRRQRQRRRALLPATVGIDTGPHIIHGVRVGGGAR